MKKFLIILLFSMGLSAQTGYCTYVVDGDTYHIDGKKIRLAEVDSPELSDDFGIKSRNFAQKLLLGKKVTYKVITRDRYGRYVAKVYINGQCLSEIMVKEGYAWQYKRYSNNRYLAILQNRAKLQGKGLWANKSTHPRSPSYYKTQKR